MTSFKVIDRVVEVSSSGSSPHLHVDVAGRDFTYSYILFRDGYPIIAPRHQHGRARPQLASLKVLPKRVPVQDQVART